MWLVKKEYIQVTIVGATNYKNYFLIQTNSVEISKRKSFEKKMLRLNSITMEIE